MDEIFNLPYNGDGPYLEFLDSTRGTLLDSIVAALAGAGGVWRSQLRSIAEGFRSQVGNPGDVRELHYSVGLLAQDSIKRSYDQLVTAREGWAARGHYRPGATDWHFRRFAGGVLRQALGDPAFFEATAHELKLVNVEVLNRKAAQWHRLAFGAGPRGDGAHERIQVVWGDLVVATFGLNEPASPGFVLPRGVWIGPEGAGATSRASVRSGSFVPGSDMFYPASEVPPGFGRHITKRPRRTQGIQARHFLEAGLRRMGRELPIGYGQLVREWWDRGLARTPHQQSVTVPSRIRRL